MNKSNKNIYPFSHISDTGSVRELNEDSVYVSDNLWLVADGMGGHACGEVASRLAIEEIVEQYQQTANLSKAIQFTHKTILKVSQNNPAQAGMGTTIVALACSGSHYEVSWVGDSRAYLWDKNNNNLKQLSEDHSLVARLIKTKRITEKEAFTHPKRHVITQSLGSVHVTNVEVDTLRGQWKSEQQILLCSDGLTGELTDKDIGDILQTNISNDEKIKKLLDNAKLAGGKDNISIILIDGPQIEFSSIWKKLKLFFTQ